jgi:hypothetical protein
VASEGLAQGRVTGQGEEPQVGGCWAAQAFECGKEEKSERLFALSPPCPLGFAVRSLLGKSQRYFVLEDGILHYATTRQDVSPGPGSGVWEESTSGCSEQAGGCGISQSRVPGYTFH